MIKTNCVKFTDNSLNKGFLIMPKPSLMNRL